MIELSLSKPGVLDLSLVQKSFCTSVPTSLSQANFEFPVA